MPFLWSQELFSLAFQVGSSFLLMLDVVPAIVILISAGVAGLSADLNPGGDIWKALSCPYLLDYTIYIIYIIFIFIYLY